MQTDKLNANMYWMQHSAVFPHFCWTNARSCLIAAPTMSDWSLNPKATSSCIAPLDGASAMFEWGGTLANQHVVSNWISRSAKIEQITVTWRALHLAKFCTFIFHKQNCIAMFQHLHPKHVCQDCTERLSFENAKPHSAVGPFCLIHRAYVDPCVLHVRGCTTIDYLQFRCLKHIQLHMSLLERSIMKMWNKKLTASNSRSPLALFELGDIASCQPRASPPIWRLGKEHSLSHSCQTSDKSIGVQTLPWYRFWPPHAKGHRKGYSGWELSQSKKWFFEGANLPYYEIHTLILWFAHLGCR